MKYVHFVYLVNFISMFFSLNRDSHKSNCNNSVSKKLLQLFFYLFLFAIIYIKIQFILYLYLPQWFVKISYILYYFIFYICYNRLILKKKVFFII